MLGRSFVQSRCPTGKHCTGGQVMAGRRVIAARAVARGGQEDRKTGAKQLTASGVDRSAVLFAITGMFAAGRNLHHLADMHRVIRLCAQARRMRGGHRRHDGDREYGKHSDEAREHAGKIGAGHGNVNYLRRRASGRNSSSACSQ